MPTPSLEELDAVAQLWILLGVPEEMVQLLAEVGAFYNPVTRKLQFWESVRNDCQWECKVHTAMLGALRITQRTGTRFHSTGRSAQSLVVGCAVGLDKSVSVALARPDTMRCFLGGYEKMTPVIRRIGVCNRTRILHTLQQRMHIYLETS